MYTLYKEAFCQMHLPFAMDKALFIEVINQQFAQDNEGFANRENRICRLGEIYGIFLKNC